MNNDLTLEVSAPVDWVKFQNNPKIRLWDYNDTTIYLDTNGDTHPLSLDASGNDIPIKDDDRWYELEEGILVWFEKEKDYRTGDYWMIPARSITRSIEWPVNEKKEPRTIPPHGPIHHYCPLAILDFDGKTFTGISDRRCVFLPLTELIHFFYVGGDGQEIIWSPKSESRITFPLPSEGWRHESSHAAGGYHRPVQGSIWPGFF